MGPVKESLFLEREIHYIQMCIKCQYEANEGHLTKPTENNSCFVFLFLTLPKFVFNCEQIIPLLLSPFVSLPQKGDCYIHFHRHYELEKVESFIII